ncbi:MAG: acetyl-CoA acetyltransferase [Myxococcota bacterium]
MNRALILGGAQTDFATSWSRTPTGVFDLLRDVVPRGLEDAAVPPEVIASLVPEGRVGVFVGNFDGQEWMRQGHLGATLSEVDPAFAGVSGARYEAACASGSVALDAAATKIRAGEIDLAVVVGIEIMRSVDAKKIADFLGTCALYEDEARGVDFVFPKMFGQITDHVIEKAEVPESRIVDALTQIARTNHDNAKRNPRAQTRRWGFDDERAQQRERDYNPYLGGRTRYLDCSQITDGGAVVVLASESFAAAHAKRTGRARPMAAIEGWGHREAPIRFLPKLEASDGKANLLPWTRRAIADAYARAGVTVDQIDVIETHDCFTVSEYLHLSAFGIAEPGHEYRAVEEGRIGPQGSLPVNPSGGLIGAGHPVGATGVRMALDLSRQVTGHAGDTQVEGARRGAMLNIGGSFTTNMSFVIGRVEH